MRCHYCDRAADLVVEREDVRIGLCTAHFGERLAELADEDWAADLRDELEP